MFTIEQIKQAHSKVKSGADFPAYIREIKSLGVTGYETFVKDGHTDYTGNDGQSASWDAKYAAIEVAGTSNSDEFKKHIKAHQQGLSDYPTLCKQAADCGVEKWKVDLQQLTCTYYDKKGNIMLEEKIPG